MKKLIVLLCLVSIPAHPAENLRPEVRLRKAMEEYSAAHYDKAIELLNPYSDGLESYALMLLASAYSKKELYGDEIRVLNVMADRDEKSSEARMLLGQAYEKQAMKAKDTEAAKKFNGQAIVAFRESVALRPKFKPAFDSLLAALLESGDPKDAADARDLLADGLERFGHRPELMKEECRLDSMQGFVSQAVRSCREAIHLAPAFPDSYVFLVQSLFDEKEDTSAEHEIVDAAKRFPASEFVQWSAGTVFYRKKNFPVSTRYFGQAVKADPESSRSQFGYAQSLFESGQEKEALPVFQKACTMDPKNVTEVFFTASSRLRNKGNPLGGQYKEAANLCHAR